MEKVIETFGRSAFGKAVFYNDKSALRFQLAVGDTKYKQFQTALDRAWTISKDLFSDVSNISVCLSWYSQSEKYISSLSLFRRLADGVDSIPRPYSATVEKEPADETGENWFRHFLTFDIPLDDLYGYLWGTMARELGISPKNPFTLYIYSCELGVLMYPYDDRGMDVLGPNRERLTNLFVKRRNWLLEYDMIEMRRRYGLPDGDF